MDFKLTAG